jgi:hypothetical protein
MNIEGLPPIISILAEIDFNATGVFGVPLGTILLIYILMNMNNNSPRQSSGPSESEIAATNSKHKENRRKYIAGTSRLERWMWIIMVLIIPIALTVKIVFDMFNMFDATESSIPLLFESIVSALLFFGGGFMWVHRMNYVVVNYQRQRQSSSPSTTTKKPSEVGTESRTNVSQGPRRFGYGPDFAYRKMSAESEKPFTMEEFLGDDRSTDTKQREFNNAEAEELLVRSNSFIRLKNYRLALEVILIYLSLPMLPESAKRQGLRIREYARAKCNSDEQDKVN